MLCAHDKGRRWRRCGAGDVYGLAGLIDGLATGVVPDCHLAGETGGFGQQRGGCDAGLIDPTAGGGAADTDRRRRRGHGHGVGIGLSDLAADEGEGSLKQRNVHASRLLARIVDHLVEGHAAAFAQRKRAFVGENDADGAVFAGLQNIALEYRRSLLKRLAGAVRMHHLGLTGAGFDPADGFTVRGRRCLGVLSGSQRAGQTDGDVSFQHYPVGGRKIGWVFLGEIIADEEFLAIGTGQLQVGAGAFKLSAEKPSVTGNDDRLAGVRSQDRRSRASCGNCSCPGLQLNYKVLRDGFTPQNTKSTLILLAPISALLTGPCSDGGHKAAFYADFRHPLALTKVNFRLGAFRWNREVRHPRAPEYF